MTAHVPGAEPSRTPPDEPSLAEQDTDTDLIPVSTARTARKPGRPQQHGITKLRDAVRTLGSRVVDKRTSLGRALARWRADLVEELGGPEVVTVQQAAIIDLCTREKLMVDSLDAWIVQQPSLVNRRNRTVLPVVLQRTQIADALARHLGALGLERRQAPALSLSEYLAAKNGPNAASGATPGPTEAPSEMKSRTYRDTPIDPPTPTSPPESSAEASTVAEGEEGTAVSNDVSDSEVATRATRGDAGDAENAESPAATSEPPTPPDDPDGA